MATTRPARVIERKVIYPGQIIFKVGDEGDRAYLVQEGQVEIFRPDEIGGERLLGEIGKGGIFGEMALVDDQPRMASARAKEQTTLAIVTRVQFQEKMQASDPFIRALLKIFVRNIRTITDRTA